MSRKLDAINIFNTAVESVKPACLMEKHLRAVDGCLFVGSRKITLAEVDKLIVIAAGKAAAAMAQRAEQQFTGIITAGICITKYGHGLPLQKMDLLEAAHPVPDENSLLAGKKVLELISGLESNDVVLVLLSGGASALLCDVPKDCSLEELQTTVDLLLRSGAGIHEINTVRKHLSYIKGGQLARSAQPARVFSLVLSDVVGDDLDVIASGPTVPDPSTFEDVWQVIGKYELQHLIPINIKAYIEKGLNKLVPDTPKVSEQFFKNTVTQIIGSNRIALKAAEEKASSLGYHTFIYRENVTDDAEALARMLMRELQQYKRALPACVLLGGETTVKVQGNGKGGRNQHFVLCALDELAACNDINFKKRITVLSGGTDGTDGPTDAAGAIGDWQMTESNGLPIKKYLSNFDAYHFFKQTNGLINTGPTQTNVMDIMMVLIGE